MNIRFKVGKEDCNRTLARLFANVSRFSLSSEDLVMGRSGLIISIASNIRMTYTSQFQRLYSSLLPPVVYFGKGTDPTLNALCFTGFSV